MLSPYPVNVAYRLHSQKDTDFRPINCIYTVITIRTIVPYSPSVEQCTIRGIYRNLSSKRSEQKLASTLKTYQLFTQCSCRGDYGLYIAFRYTFTSFYMYIRAHSRDYGISKAQMLAFTEGLFLTEFGTLHKCIRPQFSTKISTNFWSPKAKFRHFNLDLLTSCQMLLTTVTSL